LRLIYQAADRHRAAQLLYRWLAYCADTKIPEPTRLARTIDFWPALTPSKIFTSLVRGSTRCLRVSRTSRCRSSRWQAARPAASTSSSRGQHL
jgi:hypothetical protein